MEEKNNFAMVRCEFESDGTVSVRGDFNCNVQQSVFFLAEVLNVVANQLGLEPSGTSKLALQALKFSRQVVDGTDSGEES